MSEGSPAEQNTLNQRIKPLPRAPSTWPTLIRYGIARAPPPFARGKYEYAVKLSWYSEY